MHDKIRTEYLDIVKKGGSDYKVGKNEEKLHHGEWDWHSYISKGEKDSSFKQHCPETARILESIPAMADTPFSFAFFSTLSSKSSISAHTAPCNIRLRCHFPLIVPTDDTAKCGMRVADEKRSWYPGKAIIFDDSFEHEVWNHSSAERVVLLVRHPYREKEIDLPSLLGCAGCMFPFVVANMICFHLLLVFHSLISGTQTCIKTR